VLFGICTLMVSIPGVAHHSGALWDQTKKVTLHGTVKQFQWTNPHCFIQLMIPVEATSTTSSTEQEWSIEMASPFQVLSGGWKPGTLRPGDRIEITIHPARDGSSAGNFVSAIGVDGKPLGKQSPAP
jgi:hypothetical protein